MANKNNKRTIGEISQTRNVWKIDATTKVKQGKKGKGAYNRKNIKVVSED